MKKYMENYTLIDGWVDEEMGLTGDGTNMIITNAIRPVNGKILKSLTINKHKIEW